MKLLAIALIFWTFTVEANSSWKQFSLGTLSLENVLAGKVDFDTFCTGTLLNIEGQCHLITNAHCFNKNSDHAFVRNREYNFPEYAYELRSSNSNKKSGYDFFDGTKDFVELTTIKKRFISKDLAELNVTENIRPYCADLKPIDSNVLKNVTTKEQAYAAIGFYMSVPTVSFSKDKPWSREKGRTRLLPYQSSLNIKHFYQISDLSTFRGMSGGILINEDKMPIGILTRHIPYQEDSFVIGMPDVIQFLKDESEPSPINPEIYFEGNHLIYKSNNEDTIGENAHGNGGENSHGNGADPKTKGSVHPKLSLFRLPDEGVIDPLNKQMTVLSKCGIQIDGYEDYVRLKNCHEDIILRPRYGKIPLEFQKNLTERMLGNFGDHLLTGKAHKTLYVAHTKIIDQWQKIAHGNSQNIARISGNNFYLFSKAADLEWIFNTAGSGVRKLGRGTDRAYQVYFYTSGDGTAAIIEYASEKASPDGGTIFTLEYKNLKCDERQFLKIICSDDQDKIEFSLSKKSIQTQSLDFRLAMRTGMNIANLEGHEIVIYQYGEIKTDEEARLSGLPSGHPILLGL